MDESQATQTQLSLQKLGVVPFEPGFLLVRRTIFARPPFWWSEVWGGVPWGWRDQDDVLTAARKSLALLIPDDLNPLAAGASQPGAPMGVSSVEE